MTEKQKIKFGFYRMNKSIFKNFFFLILISCTTLTINAQSEKTITVTKTSDLNFGTFTTSSSSVSLTMTPDTGRQFNGVILLNTDIGYPASFEVLANKDEMITINVSKIVDLTNGTGGSMKLNINSTHFSKGLIFLHTGDKKTPTEVFMGGELSVNPSTPFGIYSGSVTLDFGYQ